MKPLRKSGLEDLWKQQGAEWRAPAQITGQFREGAPADTRLLQSRIKGAWWELLDRTGISLFISREYEHLVLALSSQRGKPRQTYFAVPHPSGIVVDRTGRRMTIASTRNPNQIFVLRPAIDVLPRDDRADFDLPPSRPFVPVSTAFFPGSLYIHDLAVIGGELHANAVGHNAIVRLGPENRFERVWWPKCVEKDGFPVFTRNHIQMNSIAPGKTTIDSYYSASSCSLGGRRPGHLTYKVDQQGVIFSGYTREPICHGLTRPHSARLHNRRIWVANSGYGEFGYVDNGKLQVVSRLAGWTRGLCIVEDIAFVGTSRIIQKYACYAPGLDCDKSRCAVHAVCLKTGKVIAHIEWPWGNQIFAIDWIASSISGGFPFQAKHPNPKKQDSFFYAFLTDSLPLNPK